MVNLKKARTVKRTATKRTATKRELMEFFQTALNEPLENLMDKVIAGGKTLRENVEDYIEKKRTPYLNKEIREHIFNVFKFFKDSGKPVTFFDFVFYVNETFAYKTSYQRVAAVLRSVADRQVLQSTDINGRKSKQVVYTIKPCYEMFVK